jgi:arylsulfatase A-like enzyme
VRKRADVVNQELLSWIDRGRNGRGETHPFFAFLNYFDVHYPYGGPPSIPSRMEPPAGSANRYQRKYDDSLGRLMQALDQRGLSSDTLVLVTSDHGESLGQHGLTYHGQALYRELIHVPLVIFYPGHVPAGVKVPGPVTNAAIPATIMDILGARTQQNVFPSSSLSALWQAGAGTDWPDPLSELARNDIADKEDRAAAKIVPTATTGSMKSGHRSGNSLPMKPWAISFTIGRSIPPSPTISFTRQKAKLQPSV